MCIHEVKGKAHNRLLSTKYLLSRTDGQGLTLSQTSPGFHVSPV